MSKSFTKTFRELFRNSPFIKMGDYRNSLVTGEIKHATNDSLYVDIGLKFYAVVKRPQGLYNRGAKVNLRLIDYELTDRFVGSDTDTTVLEADAVLIGLK